MAATTTFINYVNDSLIRERTTKDNKRSFVSVSIPTDRSESGYGSIVIGKKQLIPAKNKSGEAKPGYHSVILGDPQKTRKMSVLKDGTYTNVDVSNADIAKDFDTAREAYKAAAAAEA